MASVQAINSDVVWQKGDRLIARWLFVVAAMIFAMVVVGGITRLTESGLSMVRWEPVKGIIPPLTEEAWQAEFAAYQQYPEYQKVNLGMTLDEFKAIYWWEFGHRLLGRSIGLVFLLPFLVFLAKGYVRPKLKPKLWAMFVLGGLQGALGWYMVASGLVDQPDVSHYRLAAHLMMALIIYAYILWVAFDLVEPAGAPPSSLWRQDQRASALVIALAVLVTAQITLGAFVAGLNAGFSYNTWPLMDGRFIPTGLWLLEPWWHNLLENHTMLQFLHRMGAYAALIGALLLWLFMRRSGRAEVRLASHLLLAAMLIQVILGIITLLLVVPVSWGAAHQAGAVIVLTALLFLAHKMRRA